MNVKPQAASNGPGRLAFADAVRGLAALWVVLFHLAAGSHIADLLGLFPDTLRFVLFDQGHLGVAAFFVLSGFVMALNTARASATSAFTLRFVARRLVRLTPPYYFAIGLSLAFLLIKAQWFGAVVEWPSWQGLAAHAFYLQDMLLYPQINGVFWTLCVEVQFYIVFAILLWIIQRFGNDASLNLRRTIVLWIGGVLALAWPLGVLQDPGWAGSFLPYWYSFAGGAVVSWGWLHKGKAMLLAWTYCAAAGLVAYISGDEFAVVAAATALMLLLAANLGGMGRWMNFRWAQFLGLISYSLYLIHNNIIGGTYRVVGKLLPAGLEAQIVGAVLSMILCILFSWMMFRWIEKPCIGWSRKISVRKGQS